MTDISTRHFWTENYGNLYPTLKRLEQEELVTSERQPGDGKPDRKVYTITDAGREVLQHWLETPAEATPPRNELLLKLFLGRQAPLEVNQAHLKRFRTGQEELIATYEGIERWLETEQAGDPNLPYWLLTLSYGRLQAEALKCWSAESLETLQNLSAREERS
jgi:DNA-binding PadR family transcriptional regulator